ncbi:MAG: sensor domain-containing diguanylate cyclase [Ilumatobacter sp.]
MSEAKRRYVSVATAMTFPNPSRSVFARSARAPRRIPTAGVGRHPVDEQRDVVAAFRSGGEEFKMLLSCSLPFFVLGWGRNAIGLVLDGATDWNEVSEIVTESFCQMAPKKLVALVDRRPPPGRAALARAPIGEPLAGPRGVGRPIPFERYDSPRTPWNAMIPAEHPANEAERLAELAELDILDTLPEAAYDDITLLASQICETPIALITLVAEGRQWFKSKVGTDVAETPRDISFCAHAILRPDELFMIPDTRDDVRFVDNPLTDNEGMRFYAGVPLTTANGHALGTLCVIDRKPHDLTSQQRDALRALSRQVIAQLELRRNIAALEVTAAERARYQEQLEDYQDRLEEQMAIVARQSLTDSVTALPNRRALTERLDLEAARTKRHGSPLAVAMIDVDDFKQYNDTYGHAAGDTALREVSDSLRSEGRASDLVGRWGGEEFVAILPETDTEGAMLLAERFRRAVEVGTATRTPLTVSVGVANSSGDHVDVDALVVAADEALYRAKAAGRNTVMAAG